jgi:hypothetical protein
MIQPPVQGCGKALVSERGGLSRTAHGSANGSEREAYDGSLGLAGRSIVDQLAGVFSLLSRWGFHAHPISFLGFLFLGIFNEARPHEGVTVTGITLNYILYSNQKEGMVCTLVLAGTGFMKQASWD